MKSLLRKKLKKYLFLVSSFLSILIIVCFFIHSIMDNYYKKSVYTNIQTIPQKYTALVLGAGVKPNGIPSNILYDRLEAAANLYKNGKVKKIIVSGDNRFTTYNEPSVMQKTLLTMGVSQKDIQADYAGTRTYASCWRIKHIFDQKDIIIVTQSFHMARSLFICNQLGVTSIGFIADKPRYNPLQWFYWSIRDMFSSILSIIDVYIRRPYVMGGPQISF